MSNFVSNSRWRWFIFPKYSWFTFIFLSLCAWTPHALNFKATLCRQASCISLQRYLIITPSILRDRRWPCLTLFWDNGQMLGRAFHPLWLKSLDRDDCFFRYGTEIPVSSVVRKMSTARGIVSATEGQSTCLRPCVVVDHISAFANLLGVER